MLEINSRPARIIEATVSSRQLLAQETVAPDPEQISCELSIEGAGRTESQFIRRHTPLQ
jgi:hypothetical protein